MNRMRALLKVSDYIVEYLISVGVTDVFGYPGGMVTYFMDSLFRHENRIKSHLAYHEQGAAFAACGYAQARSGLGVAFAASGPGATNLITGICSAFFDSIPVLFITGQVNSYELKGKKRIRQCGFQETDIVSMVSGVTKYAACVERAEKIRWHLDKAVFEAVNGRMGPVLLDIPMDIMKAETECERAEKYVPVRTESKKSQIKEYVSCVREALEKAVHPVLLAGQGVKTSGAAGLFQNFARKNGIPVVTSMISADVMGQDRLNYGFIGAYGSRAANFIAAKSDLLISFASRMDIRQTGREREGFAPNAKIFRVDIDEGELAYRVHEDEIAVCADVKTVLEELSKQEAAGDFSKWVQICNFIRNELQGMDESEPNRYIRKLSRYIPDNSIITTDVGQNQVWISQSFEMKKNQKFLYSGSNGAMGYSLPAAAGAAVAAGRTVYSFQGDGGIQMNIQELQMIVREKLPVKIIILNNHALGMIRHFQEMYFDKNYCMTVEGRGYSSPDFGKIADAYGIPYKRIDRAGDILNPFTEDGCEMIEVVFDMDTYVFPKLEYGKPNQDQEPLLERWKYSLFMDDEKIQMELKKTASQDMKEQ